MTDSDAALVERCRAGDQSAMRSLVERFQGAVFGLCFRMLSHREDAEDVAQDVFLRTFRSLGGWDPARPLKPWILTIAANRCRTFLQLRSRQSPAVEFAADLAQAKDLGDAADLAEEVQVGLETLRDDYRLCVTLFYQQEMSVGEIAAALGCAEGTVKTWLFRARQQLADYFTQRGVLPHVAAEIP